MAKKRRPPADWPETPAGTDADLDALVAMLAVADAIEAEATRETIRETAQILLDDLSAKDAAPRLKTAIERLREIEDLAGRLQRAVAEADVFTIGALHDAEFSLGDLDKVPAARAALVALDPPDADDALHPLALLSRLAGAACGALAKQYGTGDADAPDQGGAGNLYTAQRGSAKRKFVHACAGIYGDAHGHVAITSTIPSETASRGGGFYRFVAAVWQYATGLEAEGAGLVHPVKATALLFKELHEIEQRQWEVMSIMTNSRRLGLGTSDAQAELQALLARRQAIQDQLST